MTTLTLNDWAALIAIACNLTMWWAFFTGRGIFRPSPNTKFRDTEDGADPQRGQQPCSL